MGPLASGRSIELEGPENFRDLGGYKTAEGMTRWRLVYRSDSLAALTHHDVGRLLAGGLRTVVDLRREDEIRKAPNVLAAHPDIQFHHNPITIPEPGELGAYKRLLTLDFAEHYVRWIRDSGHTFATPFRLLGSSSTYPLVFHCSGGRDRTGVVAALMLAAAGVRRDCIMEDFLLSNQCLGKRLERMSQAYRQEGLDPEPLLANFELREAYLARMLATLDQDYGGTDGYLQSIGVTPDELLMFRTTFVSPTES